MKPVLNIRQVKLRDEVRRQHPYTELWGLCAIMLLCLVLVGAIN